MTTFYILPPREHIEHAVAEFLNRLLPGVPAQPKLTRRFPDLIAAAHPRPEELFFIHREDMPGLGDVTEDLTRCFGAEEGDEVVEIGPSSGLNPARVQRWTIDRVVTE